VVRQPRTFGDALDSSPGPLLFAHRPRCVRGFGARRSLAPVLVGRRKHDPARDTATDRVPHAPPSARGGGKGDEGGRVGAGGRRGGVLGPRHDGLPVRHARHVPGPGARSWSQKAGGTCVGGGGRVSVGFPAEDPPFRMVYPLRVVPTGPSPPSSSLRQSHVPPEPPIPPRSQWSPVGPQRPHPPLQVRERIERARTAQRVWSASSFADRRRLLRILHRFVVENMETIATVCASPVGGGGDAVDVCVRGRGGASAALGCETRTTSAG